MRRKESEFYPLKLFFFFLEAKGLSWNMQLLRSKYTLKDFNKYTLKNFNLNTIEFCESLLNEGNLVNIGF